VRVALLFSDGVGIGRRDPEVNPLARGEFLLSRFEDGSGTPLPPGGAVAEVDATFGVPGRPQSATNQTAILTGLPAPRMIGKHLLGFPNPPLLEILRAHSLVKRLVEAGNSATFANAYPAAYLDALGLRRRASSAPEVTIPEKLKRRLRPSASTAAMAAGDVPLRTIQDAVAGQALTNDIDGERARRRGFAAVPSRTPEEAAGILWSIASSAEFTMFEHFLADEAGHARDMPGALRTLDTFDRFARAVIASRPPDAHVIVCSDHGNVEDLSTRSHTLGRVAVLWFGPDSEEWVAGITDVAGVGRSILALFGTAPQPLPESLR
jgi:Metalloenzyme superfamily